MTAKTKTMCLIKQLHIIVVEGAKTFRSASTGQYRSISNEIEKLREEVGAMPSSVSKDKRNLQDDRKKIAQDMRTAFDKIVTTHG